jgi:hypothetical protein
MGPTALLPLRSKSCYGFLCPLKIHRPRPGLNPRTLRPVANMITARPLRRFLYSYIKELQLNGRYIVSRLAAARKPPGNELVTAQTTATTC